jgi:hypothetical protein
MERHWTTLKAIMYYVYFVDSKRFWWCCITLRITAFFDFFHRRIF